MARETKVDGDHVTVNYNHTDPDIIKSLKDDLKQQAKDLGMVEGALNSFFAAIGRDSVPIEDWSKALIGFANHYNELLAKVG